MFSRHILSVTLASIAILPLAAQAETSIVIYALRSPVELGRIASSVTVITREQIERENKSTVTELLREVPGLNVANNGGAGQTTRVFMRGTNSNHVLVILDGVAINDPSDPATAVDLSNLTTDNIERIEILRGPQSTLYGSQAIGGVINIMTRQGRGKPRHNAHAEYGRYNTRKLGAGTSGEIGRTSYSFQVGQQHTDGISSFDRKFGGREKDGSDGTVVSTNLVHRLTENFTAKTNLRYNRTDTEFDSPGGFTRPSDDSFPINDSRQINGRVSGELSLMENQWTQELGVSYLHLNRSQITEYFDSSFNAYFGRQQYKGWRETVDWVHHFKFLRNHLFTAGLEASSDHYKSYSSTAGVGTAEVNVDNRAVFIDDQYNVMPDLFVNAGARLDDHQSFGREFTWKVAPAYTIAATGTRLKATYGTGFKAPALFQLFDAASGNNQLNPERSRGYDAGFEQPFFGDRLNIGATWFHNNIQDLIGLGPAPLYPTVNIGKARTQGVESTMKWHPEVDWTVTATYTFTQSDNTLENTRLLRRPKHMANLGATYEYRTGNDVGVDIRYVGLSKDIDFTSPYGRVDVKSFTTVNLNTNYKVNDTVTLYGRLDNLFDKRYEEVYGYGMPGMSLFAGVKTNF